MTAYTEEFPPTPQPPFDTFVFDLDGTLLDTLPDLVELTNTVLERRGFPTRTRDEILSYVGNGVEALMYQAVPEDTPQDAADAALAEWKRFYPEYGNDLTKPYPLIPELLDELRARGCKLAVLSNKFDDGVHQIMDKCMPGVFEIQRGENENTPRKPDPTGLLQVIADLGSTPERSVYIGDSPNDVLVARRAGCYAVGVPWGYHEREDFPDAGLEPDLMLESPMDLLALTE